MDPHELSVTVVDSFTRQAGLGNRAGIVLDAPEMSADEMIAVARAVGASETAFVRPGSAGADFAFRYFTPEAEVEFCGHDTIATFHLLAELGRVKSPGHYTLECPAGRLEVELEPILDHTRVWMATPRAPWEASPIPAETLISLLGGAREALSTRLPAMRSGLKLMAPLASRRDLWSLNPRWDDLAKAGLAHGIQGFYAFALDAENPAHIAQGRFFAPAMGVREDPVTGSASGVFAEYLALQGVLSLPPLGGTVRARIEQGHAIGKPGHVELEVSGRPGAVERVRVGGVGVTVMKGTLHPSSAPRPAAAARG